MTMQANPKILEIYFFTPFLQTAAYGGVHRPLERIVLRQRKLVNGKQSNEWDTPTEFVGWTARIEGPSLFLRPAPSGSKEQLPEEWEIPRAHVGIKWDRTGESARAGESAKADDDNAKRK